MQEMQEMHSASPRDMLTFPDHWSQVWSRCIKLVIFARKKAVSAEIWSSLLQESFSSTLGTNNAALFCLSHSLAISCIHPKGKNWLSSLESITFGC